MTCASSTGCEIYRDESSTSSTWSLPQSSPRCVGTVHDVIGSARTRFEGRFGRVIA
jgi:hypothetical protein